MLENAKNLKPAIVGSCNKLMWFSKTSFTLSLEYNASSESKPQKYLPLAKPTALFHAACLPAFSCLTYLIGKLALL